MTLAFVADRTAAAAFMLAAGLLLAWRGPVRRARIAWIALIVLGAGYDLALNLQPVNFPNSNFDHYYLGAKYPAPYAETYRLIHAGQGRPQIGMRDLEDPVRLVRSTPYEQRAYFIDLLRAAQIPFDPLAPTDTLAARARDSGVIEAEAQRILAARLPARRIAEYRRDVQSALSTGQGPRITLDYGYNGSPFYGLVRRLDPTLQLPFGTAPALAGMGWQLLGVLLVALLAGAALGLSPVERLAVAALVLVSAEFAKYAMPGLVFTELWVPLLLAVWALRRGRPALAGVAFAFAGMIKLFPFALVLVGAIPLARSLGPGAAEKDAPRIRRNALLLLASCAAATALFWLLSLASGRTWGDFFAKIVSEFQSEANMINSVSFAAALTTLGVPVDSPIHRLVALVALVLLAALFWARRDVATDDALARRALLLVAAMGWLAKSWLNYYAIAPFLLLPSIARRHRAAGALMAAGMAVAYLLPDFYEPAVARQPSLHLLKLVPYLAVPAWLVWLELRTHPWGRDAGRACALAAALLALGIGVETWRGREIRALAARGEVALADSNPALALQEYEELVRLAPRDANAQRKRAIALAMSGRLDQALAGFARAAALAPRDAAVHDDYGRALLLAGRNGEAAEQIEAASTLEPTDVQILVQLARVRQGQGRRPEAMELLKRARELAPEEAGIEASLKEIQGR